MRNFFVILLMVIFLSPSDVYSQGTITRKKNTDSNVSNGGGGRAGGGGRSNVTVKKKTTRRTVTYGNGSTGSGTRVTPPDDEVTMTWRTMESGVKLYGKVLEDFVDNADAQKTVREALNESTNAKTGCLTDNSAIFISGGNGYNSNNLPDEMSDALHYCNEKRLVVDDVAVTSIGWWCVIYNNGKNFKGRVPTACEKALKTYVNDNEKILSVSISEDGNYAIITDSHYEASNSADVEMLKAAGEEFGMIKSVCITNKATLVVCSGGIMYMNVPKSVIDNLERQDFSPTVVRYTDSGTYIALDGAGGKSWYM